MRLCIWIGLLLLGDARAAVVANIDRAIEGLLGHPAVIVRPEDAEARGLGRAAAKHIPWSGSFWPDINGGIASHWRDHTALGSQMWFAFRHGIARFRLLSDFESVQRRWRDFGTKELNQKLSPSEKYDLLIGNEHFEFTRAILEDIEFRAGHLKKSRLKDGSEPSDREEGEGVNNDDHFFDASGAYARFDSEVLYRYWKRRPDSLSYWFGICDGWSPAAIHLPRPVRPVTVRGALGHRITFFPDDLKALGSYLFARTNNEYMSTVNYRFAGRACAEWGDPETDRQGYVRDFRCNDLDPGLFHLVLLNRIGVDGMGFMMDIDNNHKINNHPVGAYEIQYFNPATGKEGSWKASLAPRFLVEDGYARRRNPETAFLVGVKARVNYRYYQWPENHRDRIRDAPEFDESREGEYLYDLEIDRSGKVLGGEWGNRFDEDLEEAVLYAVQPDFLWMASPEALPYSEQSLYALPGRRIRPENPLPFGNMEWRWDGKGAIPPDWLRSAREDAVWSPPVVGSAQRQEDGSTEVFPVEARNSILKPAQPLSTLIWYLFDRASEVRPTTPASGSGRARLPRGRRN